MFYHQLYYELVKLFSRPRTYLGFVTFLLVQNLMIFLYRFSPAFRQMQRIMEGNGCPADEYMSALTIAVMLALAVAYVLLPLFIAMVAGDLMARETEEGTMRLLLSRPVSRERLLALKWLAGALFTVLLVGALGVIDLLFAALWFPWGGVVVFVPGEIFSVFDATEGLRRYIVAHGFMVFHGLTVLGLSLMLSCFPLKTATATTATLAVVFVTTILNSLPYFRDLQPWFLAYHLNHWQLILVQSVPWGELSSSLWILAGLNLTFLVVGLTSFHLRDIKT